MRRQVFNILATLSLVLCVAVVLLWIRSQSIRDVLHWRTYTRGEEEWHSFIINTVRGGVQFESYRLIRNTPFVSSEWSEVEFDLKESSPEILDWTRPVTEESLGRFTYPYGWPDLRKPSPWIAPRVQFFADRQSDASFINSWRGVVLPYWLVATITGAPSALRAGRAWRRCHAARRRRRSGLCSTCGYDMRASGTCCPECGKEARTIRVKCKRPSLPRFRRRAVSRLVAAGRTS